jgi:dUTP pyrophosphatase
MAASNGAAAAATDSIQEHPAAAATDSIQEHPAAAATDSVQEPPQKISKISPLLKVKKLSDKAVLPSRGSALAAGYDLSRYIPFIAAP